MAYKYMYKHPGAGSHLVLCDVCKRKLMCKDTVLITDKYNDLYGMRVCKDDADTTNPQVRLRAVKERQITNPDLLRPDNDPNRFIHASDPSEIDGGDNPNTPTPVVASAPLNLVVVGLEDTYVELQWDGPDYPGSGPVLGWKIERESPTGGGFITLTTSTSPALYYKDTTISAGVEYNYRVSLVNAAGAGATSNQVAINVQDLSVLLLENGSRVLLEDDSFVLFE